MCLCSKKIKQLPFLRDKRVGLIKLEGVIIDSEKSQTASKIIEALQNASKLNIKSLVLRINSPGGTVGASQEIYNAIKKIQEKGVKVVASFGDISASGGVYVGVGADKIITNPGTITGSIGVIIKAPVLKNLYDKIGIDMNIVKSGRFKDILSELKHLSDEEKQILQDMVDSTYVQFVETVAKERNLDIETVKSFADGRVFTGSQAVALGLADEVGSQADAIKLAAELAEIEGEPRIVDMTPKKSFLQSVTSRFSVEQVLENVGINSSIYSGIPLWLMPGL